VSGRTVFYDLVLCPYTHHSTQTKGIIYKDLKKYFQSSLAGGGAGIRLEICALPYLISTTLWIEIRTINMFVCFFKLKKMLWFGKAI
jgi:hypothetical protein